MDQIEAQIVEALLRRAEGFASDQGLQIAFPNVEFTPPSPGQGVYWLKVSLLPAPSVEVGISFNSHVSHSGIMQMDVFAALGNGEVGMSRIASDAVNYFRRGTVMQSGGVNVNVYRQPYRSQAIKDEPWMMMAISIPYQCYARQPDQ